MNNKASLNVTRVLFFSCILVSAISYATEAATLEQETAARIEKIRAIRPGQSHETIAAYNQQMNTAWQFYTSHKPEILPILRSQLRAEMVREQPGDLVLLDVGLFIDENDGAEGKSLARDALFHLNPRAVIVNENHKELFELVHAAAEDHDVRVLALIDGKFLTSDERIFIPQHALQLDGTLVCVFLYGAYGPDAETYLRAKLKDRSLSKRVLEVLVWLGSPDSVRQVADTLSASPTFETLSRVTAFMMQVAGPAGRDYMIKLDPKDLDPQSRNYLAKVRSAIQNMSFESIRDSLSQFPGDIASLLKARSLIDVCRWRAKHAAAPCVQEAIVVPTMERRLEASHGIDTQSLGTDDLGSDRFRIGGDLYICWL